MKNRVFRAFLPAIIIMILWPSQASSQAVNKLEKQALAKLNDWHNPVREWNNPPRLRIDSLKVNSAVKSVDLYFPVAFSYNPFREETIEVFTKSVINDLGRKFREYSVNIYTGGSLIQDLVPNYFRKDLPQDASRIITATDTRPVLVRKPGSQMPSAGLGNRNIALWHSHGYYFDLTLDRWEWQRAKLFGTVEDLSVMGYVLPYLSTMLENAGAIVLLPRERDIRTTEVIVDNDISSEGSEFVIHIDGESEIFSRGFRFCDTIFTGDNPFMKGTAVRIKSGSADYIPSFPEGGDFGVYVSYPVAIGNSSEVRYTVRHTGGETDFIINQTIGGGTWIWLGVFNFSEGKNAAKGSVTVTANDGMSIALDAVRFGGGMGNVARRPSGSAISNQWSVNENAGKTTGRAEPDTINYTWKLSGKPRFLEGARYYLQYAGMPDTLVYSLNRNRNDYNDDYQSRGAWVNYLSAPVPGSSAFTGKTGLGIPVDLALAFHSDAGVTPDDSIIGTLGIYSTASGGGLFPSGKSRMASRDLADLVQTQIVNDISLTMNPEWTRRGLWDRPYSEARNPDVPVMLLELLSHQNKGDQMYGLDPRFRSLVSRAIYKGILRFVAFNESRDYVVQPLPVTDMAITPAGGRMVRITWKPATDPLEPTAEPAGYRLYSREGNNGFDNGIFVKDAFAEMTLPHFDTIYSFRVTAVNEGGESAVSETVSAGLKRGTDDMVLVVNGFDRISGPAWFDRAGMAGVEWWNDRGVPDHYDIVATGDQYDFDRNSPWIDDDAPGWGASYSDREGVVTAGNTFDYPIVHGSAIMAAGYSFFSVSDEVFCSADFSLRGYKAVDLIFGEEKSTPSVYDSTKIDFSIYTPEFVSRIDDITEAGVPLFMSGSYVGTDLAMASDTAVMRQVGRHLHFKFRTGHAVKKGSFYSTDRAAGVISVRSEFNTSDRRDIYTVEAPDAIEPYDKTSLTAIRYSENNTSAGVFGTVKNRTAVLGFPFETVVSEEDRNQIMKYILDFLTAH